MKWRLGWDPGFWAQESGFPVLEAASQTRVYRDHSRPSPEGARPSRPKDSPESLSRFLRKKREHSWMLGQARPLLDCPGASWGTQIWDRTSSLPVSPLRVLRPGLRARVRTGSPVFSFPLKNAKEAQNEH